MSMYETGTVSATADATTITGSGTKWADQRNGIGPQCTIAIYGAGTVDLYAIARVDSDTQITVTRPVSRAFSGSAYGVLVAETQSVQYFANMLAAQLGYYQSQMDGWQEIMTGDGSVTITAPDGREVTISSFKKLTDDMVGKAASGVNSDITELKGLTTALSISQGGTGAKTAADARNNLGLGTAAINNTGDTGSNIPKSNQVRAAHAKSQPGLVSNVASDFGSNFNSLSPGDYAIGSAAAVGMSSGPGITGQHWASVSKFGWNHSFLVDWVVDSGLSAVHLGTRFYNGSSGSWSGWTIFYNNRNTTKASDGTLKAASPVVKLFTDGSFDFTDEAEGVTVIRQGIGKYLIEGCQGLNSDAEWGGIDGGFDIPTDRNKQPLLWLDYDVNADGSVLVKTFHRTHPTAPVWARNERDGYTDGDPIDIPSDQYVSVRVGMPLDSIWNQKQQPPEQTS
ncbi:hypothetical protein FEM41_19800 [Jejubacter calystegiae]|uniref:Phage tail protein C-terminal domain-containing protein n=1 Tax=Jejubacter calystegiae TaxID=2579935 RepID=A0A4P8YPM9_9ENTR|nr:hypothetical protein [Jejubacter calystegiae]QCT21734.1 hypothetical protein FEM41_19800 [Jejubacter calystegiae]